MEILHLLSGAVRGYRGKALRRFFIAGLVLSAAGAAHAGDVSITGVTHEKNGSITLVFNNVLSIGGITWEGAGKTRLKYPCYVSPDGVSYPQVKMLTRQAKEAAVYAAAQGAGSTKEKEALSYAVSGIRPYRGKSLSLKGFATVTFNNAIAVDCRIMVSRGKAWVAWPAVKEKESWRRLVTLRDRRFRAAVEQDIQAGFASVIKQDAGTQ